MAECKKVLVVEDDDLTRFMMTEIIATMGARVEAACNGQHACEVLADAPDRFGLVLMDLHMPVMSGVEATRTIRAFADTVARDVPIVAMTADVNFHDDARVKALGMNGFASKPVSPERLTDLIESYCAAG